MKLDPEATAKLLSPILLRQMSHLEYAASLSRQKAGSFRLVTHLQEWRKRRGVSQDDMAAVTGISRSTYSKLERGLIDNPPIRYLTNCALALGCNLSDLLEDEWLEWTVFDDRKAQPPEPEGFWRTR